MKRKMMLALLLLLCAATAMAEGTTITLTFAGDVTLGCEEVLRREPHSLVGYAKEHGYGYFFEKVLPLFESDDLTVVNLEGVFADSAKGENKKKGYRFRGPSDFAGILTEGSIEAVNLANNHVKDYGKTGLESTKAALDAAGVARFGTRDVYIYEKDGVKIAFLGLYHYDWSEEGSWLLEEIERLEGEVNATVVSFHAGVEYSKTRVAQQEKCARRAVDAGADLVIMHHPHVVQGMDVMDNRSVLYSLGNFCFGGNRHAKVMESLVASAALSFDADGTYVGQQITLYPAFTTGTDTHNNYQPHFVSGEQAAQVMALVQQDTPFALAPFDEAMGCTVQPYLPADGGAL